jgi:hypothetical protein
MAGWTHLRRVPARHVTDSALRHLIVTRLPHALSTSGHPCRSGIRFSNQLTAVLGAPGCTGARALPGRALRLVVAGDDASHAVIRCRTALRDGASRRAMFRHRRTRSLGRSVQIGNGASKSAESWRGAGAGLRHCSHARSWAGRCAGLSLRSVPGVFVSVSCWRPGSGSPGTAKYRGSIGLRRQARLARSAPAGAAPADSGHRL